MSLTKTFRNKKGFTAVELMVMFAILAGLMMVGAGLWQQFSRQALRSRVRNALILETTTGLDTLVQFLSEATWNTVKVSGTALNPWSKVVFDVIQADHTRVTYTFDVTTNQEVTMKAGNLAPKIIMHHVTNIVYSFPRANDPSLLTVTLRARVMVDTNQPETVSRSAQIKLIPPVGI